MHNIIEIDDIDAFREATISMKSILEYNEILDVIFPKNAFSIYDCLVKEGYWGGRGNYVRDYIQSWDHGGKEIKSNAFLDAFYKKICVCKAFFDK